MLPHATGVPAAPLLLPTSHRGGCLVPRHAETSPLRCVAAGAHSGGARPILGGRVPSARPAPQRGTCPSWAHGCASTLDLNAGALASERSTTDPAFLEDRGDHRSAPWIDRGAWPAGPAASKNGILVSARSASAGRAPPLRPGGSPLPSCSVDCRGSAKFTPPPQRCRHR